jgi:hypothetical protein
MTGFIHLKHRAFLRAYTQKGTKFLSKQEEACVFVRKLLLKKAKGSSRLNELSVNQILSTYTFPARYYRPCAFNIKYKPICN